MKCIFCQGVLKEETSYANNLQVFACRDCKLPKHVTVYRQLYEVCKKELLHELIMVDDFCITKRYKSEISSQECTLIYSGVIGVMRGITSNSPLDPEPVSIHAPFCQIDHIINTDVSNLDKLKQKLSTWITFS